MNWIRFWGATEEEKFMDFPGSENLKNKEITCTHGVTIYASPEVIWKFLVQIGQNKAGFLSYRWLENLVGCQMPDIRKIVPKFQKISLGDKVFLHPKAPPLTVTTLIPEKVLALEGWYLVLNQIEESKTRLLARGYDWRDPNRNAGIIDKIFSGVFFDIAHLVMERKMLLNIKTLSETYKMSEFADSAPFHGHVEIRMNCAPAVAKAKFLSVRVQEMAIAKFLGDLRYLPARLIGQKVKQSESTATGKAFFEEILESGTLILHESKAEILTGAAGKYHQIANQEFKKFESIKEFLSFDDPRYEKLFILIRFIKDGTGKCLVTLDHWTYPLSRSSKHKFFVYWLVIKPFGQLASWLLLRTVKRQAESSKLNDLRSSFTS